jgi:hypothetical protein
VLGSVKRSHAAIVLVPNTKIQERGIDRTARGKGLVKVAPIHANVVEGPVARNLRHPLENALQKAGKLLIGHLARGHCELPVADSAKT